MNTSKMLLSHIFSLFSNAVTERGLSISGATSAVKYLIASLTEDRLLAVAKSDSFTQALKANNMTYEEVSKLPISSLSRALSDALTNQIVAASNSSFEKSRNFALAALLDVIQASSIYMLCKIYTCQTPVSNYLFSEQYFEFKTLHQLCTNLLVLHPKLLTSLPPTLSIELLHSEMKVHVTINSKPEILSIVNINLNNGFITAAKTSSSGIDTYTIEPSNILSIS